MEPILTLDEVIKAHVLNVYIVRCRRNLSATARTLGIGRSTLYRYLSAWGVK